MNTKSSLMPAFAGRTMATMLISAWFIFISTWFGLVSAAPIETANVMAPLKVNDWGIFEKQLDTVKSYGVDAVSVDVWWGEVEGAADNQFKWDYYDKIFATIKAHSLKIVPILSFHQCGGNVGDDYTSLLPSWLWGKYVGKKFNGITLTETDLQYKSELGNFSKETLQLWVDPLVAEEYTDFVTAFKDHFASYNGDIIEINVSAGPSGELRYPSYNAHDQDKTGYPTRGGLQSYSRLAVLDFQNNMLKKYQTIDGINKAWGFSLSEISKIQPPDNAEFFFNHGDYMNTQYGKDFVDWYNQSLVNHGNTLLTNVIKTLGNSFPSAKIGFKFPGVHWSMGSGSGHPRAAEVAAGLIQTSVDFKEDATGHGYSNIVGLAKTLSTLGRSIVLHFTCLEMDNNDSSPSYSLATDLVLWVANEAKRQGVVIKGENALSSGVTSDHGWDKINNAFNASYSGLTILRIGEVSSGGTGQSRYADFIRKYRDPNNSTAFPSLFVRGTYNNWSTAMPMTKIGTVWSLNKVRFGNTSSERFKFDVYGDWSQNYGGSGLVGKAIQGGNDITVTTNDTYNIYLVFSGLNQRL